MTHNIKLRLTKLQAEILEKKLTRTLFHLEDDGLTDSICYIQLTQIVQSLRTTLRKDNK